ncbi:MAG: RNA 2',3'-cyclic phosphodiesterase [Xanthomonadales bacterium]|nr:RNA 2',3'-cyclic phosphodiesterase [Xanthomonadales bacterium]
MARSFWCLPPPAAVAAALADFAAARLPEWLPGWRLDRIAAEDLHLTLRFLGEPAPGVERALAERLPHLAASAGALALSVSRLALWPGLRAARVVVLRVLGGEALAGLAARAEEAARSAGLEPERRPFRGHLTLARVRGPGPPPAAPPPVPPALAFRAEALAWWESVPQAGRRYRERLRLPLSGAGSAAV